jgi:hypothetical protein
MYCFDTRAPPKSYHREDHFGDVRQSLDFCVRQACWDKLKFWPAGKIKCVCNLRSFGYCFNPITPFFIYNEKGDLVALLTEVRNTPWAERCLYASLVKEPLKPSDGAALKLLEPACDKKIMHVSPFHPSPVTKPKNEPDWFYEFTLEATKRLVVTVYKSVNGTMMPVKEELRFTATMELDYEKSHDVTTGSIRTVLQVYKQALSLVRWFTFYNYQPEPMSFLDVRFASWLMLLVPAAYAHYQGECHETSYTEPHNIGTLPC